MRVFAQMLAPPSRTESSGGVATSDARPAHVDADPVPDDARGVLLRLDGRPVRVFSGESLILDHPLTRADFRSFG